MKGEKELPEGSEVEGRVLRIPNPENGLEMYCVVRRGKLRWKQAFKVRHSKEENREKSRMPELIEGYSCSDPDTVPVAKLSTNEMGACNEENFSNYKEERMGRKTASGPAAPTVLSGTRAP